MILDELLALDLACAPHVLAHLMGELDGHAPTIREVAELLSASQRHGLRPLPSPLPLVPEIARRFDGVIFDDRDRDLLLALSLSLDDALGPLVELDGRSPMEIAESSVGALIRVHAGHVRLIDPRLAIWLRATTAPARLSAVHERLSSILAERGDDVSAVWHRARAALQRDPDAVSELTRISRRLSESGLPERALRLAHEAWEHTTEDDGDEVRLVAGASCVGAGFVEEAAAWLSGLRAGGSQLSRLRALGGLFVAHASTRGTIVPAEFSELRPQGTDAEAWLHWTRATAVAAVLCAERGERQPMRVWLDALREGAMHTGLESDLRDPVVALCWLICGEDDVDDTEGAGPISGGVLRALRAATDGDLDLALQILAADDTVLVLHDDPFVPGFERSPLVRAYRAVLEVMLLVWRGDIAVARDRLIAASLVLPVGVPFAGLGVVLARRLDLAVQGELGPFARALTAALPSGVRIDTLVDRGIQAFLAGAYDDASAAMRLWADIGARRTSMTVPTLDELAWSADALPVTAVAVEPPEIGVAQRLRLRLAGAIDSDGDAGWRVVSAEVAVAARGLDSPFVRARVETMLGTHHAIRDDHDSARVHLQHAERLFELCGATAWARAVRDRLDRLDAREGSLIPPADPLTACRSAWALRLTARELEVAMLAITGAGNRDIAQTLSLSVRTVEVHLGRVFAKLDVRSRVELTVLAHRAVHHL